MTRLLLILSLLTTALVVQAQNLSKSKAKYEYLVNLPKDHQEKKYPLIIFLHGSSMRGNDLSKLKAYGLPKAYEQNEKFPFILVTPQCPSGKLWSTDDWFGPLYADLIKKYKVDTSRVYLIGISMGGGGVFDVAKDYPDKFAALVPLCAWASTTDRICNIKDIPVWTFHGTEDQVVPISETVEKVAALKKCKGNIQFTKLDNQGHGIHWIFENRDVYDIYQWLFKHKK
jgi:predicted peptidase